MADKMIIEGFTPERTKLILEYAQLAMKEMRRPHRTTRDAMRELRKKIGLRHPEIIAAAGVLTAPKI